MKMTIRTEWGEVVISCLNEIGLGTYDYFDSRGGLMVFGYSSDTMYRDIAAWIAGAIVCGLILSGGIER